MDVFAATVDGPPDAVAVDGVVYPLRRRWGPLLRILPGFEHRVWPVAVLAGLVEPDAWPVLQGRLFDRADGLDLADLHRIAAAVVEHATGRPYYVTGRLLGWAIADWGTVDGELALRGIEFRGLFAAQPARAVSLLQHMLMRGADDKQTYEIEALLTAAPAITYADAALWDADEEGAAFMAAHAAGIGRR